MFYLQAQVPKLMPLVEASIFCELLCILHLLLIKYQKVSISSLFAFSKSMWLWTPVFLYFIILISIWLLLADLKKIIIHLNKSINHRFVKNFFNYFLFIYLLSHFVKIKIVFPNFQKHLKASFIFWVKIYTQKKRLSFNYDKSLVKKIWQFFFRIKVYFLEIKFLSM